MLFRGGQDLCFELEVNFDSVGQIIVLVVIDEELMVGTVCGFLWVLYGSNLCLIGGFVV